MIPQDRKAVIFDIDGTLADINHRRHFVTNGRKDWASFFDAVLDDVPVMPLIELLQMYNAKLDVQVFIVTGRPEFLREKTQTWLTKFGVHLDFSRFLLMRSSKDRREDSLVKKDILDSILEDGFCPQLVFDDRKSVVDMWRNEGILVAQVAEGNF